MKPGDVLSFERSFTTDDVARFAAVSGDVGVHHVQPDERGRLVVQGLLTATLPTRVGGALDFLVRRAVLEFHRPVYTGDTIRCSVRFDALTGSRRGTQLDVTLDCVNQEGDRVLSGTTTGVIPAPLAEVLDRPLPTL